MFYLTLQFCLGSFQAWNSKFLVTIGWSLQDVPQLTLFNNQLWLWLGVPWILWSAETVTLRLLGVAFLQTCRINILFFCGGVVRIFFLKKETEWVRKSTAGGRERQTSHWAGSLTQGSISGLWYHGLRQTLNRLTLPGALEIIFINQNIIIWFYLLTHLLSFLFSIYFFHLSSIQFRVQQAKYSCKFIRLVDWIFFF